MLSQQPYILSLLQTINLHADAHHPMISLGPAATFKDNASTRHTETGDLSQFLLGTPAVLLYTRTKERFPQSMPDDKASHGIFIRRCPAIFQVHARQGMSARVVAVKGAILVEEIVFGDETTVQVTVLKSDGVLLLVMDMWNLLPSDLSNRSLKDH